MQFGTVENHSTSIQSSSTCCSRCSIQLIILKLHPNRVSMSCFSLPFIDRWMVDLYLYSRLDSSPFIIDPVSRLYEVLKMNPIPWARVEDIPEIKYLTTALDQLP